MAKKKTKSGNLHFLHDINPQIKKGPGGLEKLVRNLGKRLDGLEKEIHKNLNKIQKDLQTKSHHGPQEQYAVRKEILDLKDGFDQKINEITQGLKKTLNPKEGKSPSLWELAKRLLPDLSFLDFSHSSKSTQEIWDEEIDAFGRDPAFEKSVKPLFDFLYYRYWRISTHGLENVPSRGRALLVSNHSGTLAWDGSMIRVAVSNDHPSQRDVRFLVEDFVYYLPFIGTTMYRVGGVRASRDNAEQLLKSGHLVAVFPEGVKGIGKYYRERYHLQRFGRGGFIKLAIRTGSPIIPVAVIGAEEIHPILYKSSLLAKPLGIPYLPITPTLPWLGPLGFIPLPSKWSIYFGKPIDLSKYGKSTLEDELQIHKLSEMVRHTIQEMITEALKTRRSVWWG